MGPPGTVYLFAIVAAFFSFRATVRPAENGLPSNIYGDWLLMLLLFVERDMRDLENVALLIFNLVLN